MTRSDSPTQLAQTRTLAFSDPIIATAQAPITTKEILGRVKRLSEELQAVDQDEVDLSSLARLKQDLVSQKLLKHNNLGIQAYTCCCVADMLRLHAPDAPFTAEELTLMFKSFFSQFKKLADTNNPYHQQQCYLLKRLAEVRSVILVTDLPGAENMIESLFSVFYSQELNSRLEALAADLLSEVISEAEIVPHGVLTLILDRLMAEPVLGTTRTGFSYSVHICEANVDRMSRQVAQYFSEMLYESSGSAEAEQFKRTSGIAEKLKKVHKLSVQIWKYVPGLLNSVMGLIDDELSADDEQVRGIATETIGQMIGSSSHNFNVTHKSVWQNWIKKTLDVSPAVRCKWVEQLPQILTTLSSSSAVYSDLSDGLHKCLLDTDEKVRLMSCASVEKIAFQKFTHCFSYEVMQTLSQLIREKNSDVRSRAIKILGVHFNQYQEVISNNEVIDFGHKDEEESAKIVEQVFKQIPNRILALLYINDKIINASVDTMLMEKILPMELNNVRRVDRFCRVYSILDDKSKQSLGAITSRQHQIAKVLTTFITLVEEFSNFGSLIDKENMVDKSTASDRQQLVGKLEKTSSWLSESLPEGYNASTCLERFYKLKNFRLLHLMKVCISPKSDYKSIKNAIAELLQKLSNPKNLKLEDERINISTTDMVSTFRLILYRGSCLLHNRSNVAELIRYTKEASSEWNFVASELLDHISKDSPKVLTYQVDELVDLISVDQHNESAVHILKTLYYLFKKNEDLYPSDGEFTEKLIAKCKSGTPAEARYATKLLGLNPGKELVCSELIEQILPLEVNNDNFSAHLSTVAEMFLVDPICLENYASDLTAMLVKSVLLVNNTEIEDDSDSHAWLDDCQLIKDQKRHSELNKKLLALRFLSNRLRSLDSDQIARNQLDEVAQLIFKLFTTLIGNGGEIVKEKTTPKLYQARLRYTSGSLLLKLGKFSRFVGYFTVPIVSRLIFLLQDQNKNIRCLLLEQFQRYLTKDDLPEAFIVPLFFMCNEPETEISFSLQSWLKSNHRRCQQRKNLKWEKSLARLIHLLSHSSEFCDNIANEAIKSYYYALEVIGYFLNQLSSGENVALLYYVSSRVKQYRDASIDQSSYNIHPYPDEVNNLYRVSELAQLAIKELCDHKGWSIQTWPGRIQMADDIFAPLTSAQEAQEIITNVYISDEMQARLKPKIKQVLSGSSKRKAVGDSRPKPKRAKAVRTLKSKRPKPSTADQTGVSGPSRKSTRSRASVTYAADSSSSASELSDSEYSE